MIVPYLLIIIFIIKLTFTLTSFASQIKFLVRDPSPEGEREREIERDRARVVVHFSLHLLTQIKFVVRDPNPEGIWAFSLGR